MRDLGGAGGEQLDFGGSAIRQAEDELDEEGARRWGNSAARVGASSRFVLSSPILFDSLVTAADRGDADAHFALALMNEDKNGELPLDGWYWAEQMRGRCGVRRRRSGAHNERRHLVCRGAQMRQVAALDLPQADALRVHADIDGRHHVAESVAHGNGDRT